MDGWARMKGGTAGASSLMVRACAAWLRLGGREAIAALTAAARSCGSVANGDEMVAAAGVLRIGGTWIGYWFRVRRPLN